MPISLRRLAVASTICATAYTTWAALTIAYPVPAPVSVSSGILRPGSPDAAVVIDGHIIQIEYIRCLPALRDGRAYIWEDGSAALVNPADGSITDCK